MTTTDFAAAATAALAAAHWPLSIEKHLLAFDRVGIDSWTEATIVRLLETAQSIPVTVGWSDMGDRFRGLYLDEHNVILMNSALRAFQVMDTLAHECVHAAYRDRASTPEVEARARVLAAGMIFSPARVRARKGDADLSSGYTPKAIAVLRTAFAAVQTAGGRRPASGSEREPR